MTQKSILVNDRFSQFNCAQTVFSLFAPELGIDEATALKIASGFGGGMACAETCGAVTGSYMVIGLRDGHSTPDPEAKAHTKNQVMQFNHKFKAVHGTLICRELLGADITTPEGAAAACESGAFENICPGFIKTACEILEENY